MTVTPTFEEFSKLAKRHNLIPVSVEVVADMETPLSIFRKTGNSHASFLLESAEVAGRWSRWSFVGVDPLCVLTSTDGKPHLRPGVASSETLESLTNEVSRFADPFEQLRAATRWFSAPTDSALPPLHGGAVGYVAYDAARFLEPTAFDRRADVPEMMMQLTSSLVAFDHFRGVATVIVNAVVSKADDLRVAYDQAVESCNEVVSKLSVPTPAAVAPIPPPTDLATDLAADFEPTASNVTEDEFKEMVVKAKEFIVKGDVFQAVVSQRFSISDLDVTDIDIYRALRLLNPSPYMFLLRNEDLSVVGSSPEALVRLEGSTVITHPIAGTRPRGADDASDDAIAQELLVDQKELAEHVMLVDLARNDIGRVCEPSSVKTTRFMEIEKFSHVMHLVSEVTGELRDSEDAVDVLRATFPAGTVTGAPKVRAMQIIDNLEKDARGIYGGIVGYIGFSGNMDTAIALRTCVVQGGKATVQAGSGIVFASDPATEYQESINKASAPIIAVRNARGLNSPNEPGSPGN